MAPLMPPQRIQLCKLGSKSYQTSGVIDTAGDKIGDFKVEYLREFEAICKKGFTRESGARVGLFDEKNQRSKIS
jgi:hypothetical protein